METVMQVKKFMEPESVALVGVSRDAGEGSFNVLRHILSYGYQGRLYPINPNATDILGVKTYSSIADVRDNIDLAVITTPRELVPRLVGECGKKNVRSVVIVAQGFADARDDQGMRLQKELSDIARSSQIRVLGPNTFGVANAFNNFCSSFVEVKMKRNPIGLICQSGVFFVGFLQGELVGKGIDIGNACDISCADCLMYFEDDPDIKVVSMHIEGMQDAYGFIDVAARVACKKPLIALKTGNTERAARAAQSHTGSLTGSNEVWEASLKQAGVIRAGDLQELVDLTNAFSVLPLMEKTKIGIVTFTGGLGIMAMDSCQKYNLELGDLSSETMKLLNNEAPPWLNVGNPVDIWPVMMFANPMTRPLIDALRSLLSDEQIGAVLFIFGAFEETFTKEICLILSDLAMDYEKKPFACAIYGPYCNKSIKDLQSTGRIAAFPTPERAVRALARLKEYSQFRMGI